MIRDFQEWTVDLVEHSSLDELKGCTIAIEAADYLKTRILDDPQQREPLLPAVGGLPFGMKRQLHDDLQRFAAAGITPFFVFPGLDIGSRNQGEIFRIAEESARINEEAWKLYDEHQAEKAVSTFRKSNAVTVLSLLKFFQAILREERIRFMVAPYSACAQLAYLSSRSSETIHAIAGSSEILLFDVDKVITAFDFEDGRFSLIRRHRCIHDLGSISPDMFVDACLLAGTSTLRTLPQLESRKQLKIKGAVDMMMSAGRTGISVCMNFQDDPQIQRLGYVDNYRKSRLAIRHHIVLTKDGKLEPFDVEQAPGDMHEILGQRLPDELYFYLSKGVISPRVLTWRTSGEIIELPPVDNGTSEYYRRLVREQLLPIRTSALSLLTYSLHRFYQHKDVALTTWFNQSHKTELNVKDWSDPRPLINSWNVKKAAIQTQSSKYQGAGTLSFAIRSLNDPGFASQSITPKAKDPKDLTPLSSKEEILDNAVWRFLHLREYIDENHNLTKWGKVLSAIFQELSGKPELEEPAIVAVELLRLNLLSTAKMFDYIGGPGRGSEKDKDFVLLVSRVACLGKLHHNAIGFTGPLSRNLLGYHSITSTVRSSLRDLVEVSLVTLLLNGDVDREAVDYIDIGLELPFLLPNDCALGVAVKSYLDELAGKDDPTSDDDKLDVKAQAKQFWFPQCQDLLGDLKTAFHLWDAVYAGVKVAGDLVKEKAVWDEADAWLENRR